MIYEKFEAMKNQVLYKPRGFFTSNEAHAAHVKEYKAELARIDEQFHQSLAMTYETFGNPRELQLWGLAWQKGHAGGLSDIESQYSEMAELIK